MSPSRKSDRVDIVIVNFNGGSLLLRAVQAVMAQSFGNFRLIVVDNGSTDGSLENLPLDNPRLLVVRLERNTGFAAANNAALNQWVTAPWTALLNPDAFPDPGWLAALLSAAEDRPDCAFFGCRMRTEHDPRILDGVGDAYHPSGLYWREGHGCPGHGRFLETREIFSPCAAAALYRTADLRAVGGFDEDFFCYGEDMDVGFRLRLAGRRGLYVPSATVSHMGSGVTGRDSDFALYHGHRNLVWNYVKNMPGPLLWLCLPGHLLLNLVTLALFASRGRGHVAWQAKRDAVLGIPRMWRKRRAIHARRVVTLRALWRVMHHGIPSRRCPPDG